MQSWCVYSHFLWGNIFGRARTIQIKAASEKCRVIGLISVQNQTNSLCKYMFVLNREPPELKEHLCEVTETPTVSKSSTYIASFFSTLQNGPFIKAKEPSTGNHFIQHKIYRKYQNVHTFKFKLEKAELNLLVREAYVMLLNLTFKVTQNLQESKKTILCLLPET